MGVSAVHQWQHSWRGYVMKGAEYRGITLQAEPSSLRCVVEMKDQRQPPPLACLRCAAGPRCQKKNHRVYIREDKVRIKNKRILEHTTSFTQETTSWICGRPCALQCECSVAARRSEWEKGLKRRGQKQSKSTFQVGFINKKKKSPRGCKGERCCRDVSPGAGAAVYW